MVLACHPYYAFERTVSAETIIQPKRKRVRLYSHGRWILQFDTAKEGTLNNDLLKHFTCKYFFQKCCPSSIVCIHIDDTLGLNQNELGNSQIRKSYSLKLFTGATEQEIFFCYV